MRFLDTVVTRFVTHMDQALQGQFDNLPGHEPHRPAAGADALRHERLRPEHDRWRGPAGKDAEAGRGHAAESWTPTSPGCPSPSAESDEAYDKLSSNYEQMQLISRQQADYLREVSAMQNAVTDALSRLKDMVSGMNRAAQAMGDAGAKAEAFRGEMDQAARNSNPDPLPCP